MGLEEKVYQMGSDSRARLRKEEGKRKSLEEKDRRPDGVREK
jgi:hypothetical protein